MTKQFIIQTKTYNVQMVSNGNPNFSNIVLCFHGFNGDKWGDAYSKLKHNATNSLVYSFNSCGHGDSQVESIDMRLDIILEEIDVVLNYIKQTHPNIPIIFVAGSYGAYRVMNYLIKYKPQIQKVIYINPAFNMLQILEKLKEFEYAKLKPGDLVPMKKSLNKYITKSFLDDIYNNNLYSQKYNIEYNTHIVIGKYDTLIPADDILKIAKTYSYPVIYVNGDHCLEDDTSWQPILNLIEEIK